MDRQEIIQLYISAADEMRKSADTHQQRLSSFIALLSALFTATIAGLIMSKEWYDFLLVAIGPVAIGYVSWIGKKAISGIYSVFIRNYIVRAKYEQMLGLTVPLDQGCGVSDGGYWNLEPIISEYQLSSRSDYSNSSEKFYEHCMKEGPDQKVSGCLFNGAIALSVALFIICWVLSVNAGL